MANRRPVTWHIETIDGDDAFSGLSYRRPFKTMSKALSVALTGDTIRFRGDIREELVGSNLVFDLTIIGDENRPRHPGWGTLPGSATWRPPASPTATTPLLKVRAQGWKFENILFDCPVDEAAIYLERNALSGTDEFDASHPEFIGCRFESGLHGIKNVGGCGFGLIEDCRFFRLDESGGAGYINTTTAVAIPLNWHMRNCEFMDNDAHILGSFSRSKFDNCDFGKFTTFGVNTIYVSAQGEYNDLRRCFFSGDYSTAAYLFDTTDNYISCMADDLAEDEVDANGFVIALPAA